MSRRGVSHFGWLSSNRRLYDLVDLPFFSRVTLMLLCPPHDDIHQLYIVDVLVFVDHAVGFSPL